MTKTAQACSEARSSRRRPDELTVLLVAAALVLGPVTSVWAQEEPIEPPIEGDMGEEPAPEPEEQQPVKVTAFVFTELEMDARVATEITAGLRRGVRADERLEYIDPSKAIQADSEGEETAADVGAQKLTRAIEQSNVGQWRNVVRILDDAIELFESDLSNTSRRDLVDATMLWGAAQCKLRRARVCESAFRRVVTFRENAEYEFDLLPEGPETVFEQVRDETLEGPRGSLQIETEPPGAEVFVDGRFVGAAPTRAEGLLAGDHYVTLKMVGYERLVERVTVQTDFEDTSTFELMQMQNAPLLRDALTGAREAMGQTRSGAGMRDLWSLLLIDQVILGDLVRIGESDDFDLTLYLYDLRTNHGLRRLERRLNWEAPDLEVAEELAAELYRDVDLSGRIRPTHEPPPVEPRRHEPFYRTWWFWSIVGAVVVGTSIGVASAASNFNQTEEGFGELRVPY